jgi:nitronate monooxygenase
VFCPLQTASDAERAIDRGADVIVSQGTEGGQGGSHATLTLASEIADLIAKRTPQTLLYTAGGIADGRGLAAALMLGAGGDVVGTRFWASRMPSVGAGQRYLLRGDAARIGPLRWTVAAPTICQLQP